MPLYCIQSCNYYFIIIIFFTSYQVPLAVGGYGGERWRFSETKYLIERNGCGRILTYWVFPLSSSMPLLYTSNILCNTTDVSFHFSWTVHLKYWVDIIGTLAPRGSIAELVRFLNETPIWQKPKPTLIMKLHRFPLGGVLSLKRTECDTLLSAF